MLVLDADLAFSLVKGEAISKPYRDLFESNEVIIAPELIHAELVHTAIKYVNEGEQTKEGALQCVKDALSLIDEFHPLAEMNIEVFNEALRLEHSSYDIYYLVLARRMGATLASLDKKLNKIAIKSGVDCIYRTGIQGDPLGKGKWTVRVKNIDGNELNYVED